MRTRIYLGFLLLAVIVGFLGVMVLFSLRASRTSFSKVEESFPFLLATSRLRDILSQNNAYLSAYLLEEELDHLQAMEAKFESLNARFDMYLNALQLGSLSEEFRSQYGAFWETEQFPYVLHPLPQEGALGDRLKELEDLQTVLRTRAETIRQIWKERLITLRSRNEKAIAIDDLSGAVYNFVNSVGEEVNRHIAPLEEIKHSLFEAAFRGDPRGQIWNAILDKFGNLRKGIQESIFSEETKQCLLENVDGLEKTCKGFMEALSGSEVARREEILIDFNTAYQSLETDLEGLRINRWIERLNLFDRERKNFLLLGREGKQMAQTLADATLGSLKRFLEGNFLKIYAPAATQAVIEESFKPLEIMWQEIVQADEKLFSLEQQATSLMEEEHNTEEKLTQTMNVVNEAILGLFAAAMDTVNRTQSAFSQVLQVVTVVAILGALLLSIVISRSIVVPLHQGVLFAQTLGRGDLRQRINLTRRDEIGVLLASLSQASSALGGFLGEVSSTAREIIALTEKLHRVSQEMASLGHQVTQAVTQVAQGSEEQSQSLGKVAHQMEELVREIYAMRDSIKIQAEKVFETLEETQKIEQQISLVGNNIEKVKGVASSAFSVSQKG
ncbi:MAG: HAMP domain-containing protein, partial [Candidatus Caldatribacteriaceae bacterium]